MQIAFVTVGTDDMDASVRFYTEALDFQLTSRLAPSPGVELAFLTDPSGIKVELITRDTDPPVTNAACSVSLTFHVDDIDATYARLSEKKAPGLKSPKTLPGGLKLLLAKDPNGVVLGFIEETD
ncbi:VOC family protein [Desulfoluna spongiiphila]|uniref:VOC family protein n=1 Tax=Desulfoluna spongiiphila TaxID=419481 RepID=UPI001252E245|nr:VOC family protein [Desulfoluna spongiiphila]VVS90537.1 glyoxalase/bleomycin resistance protein/dihydroxybiphenyl dioxygenase [Desulfoluna spongiiphila]